VTVALVMAKAPVPGRVKTRLGRVVGDQRAADLAAAALLDTMAACVAAYGVERCHLALDGDLATAERADDLAAAVRGWTVHPQVGDDFAHRLVRAHHDAAATGEPVVQVGMDTPHLRADDLVEAAALMEEADDAVLGPAHDGGWWLLGVGGPHLVAHLSTVPMSAEDTGAHTRTALEKAGARIQDLRPLRDVDELEDAEQVAADAPDTLFAQAWR
jgi:rSAM/selenodomain-associated transferase 1